MRSLLFILLLVTSLCTEGLLAQQSLLDADPSKTSYKKAVKRARDARVPILAILYSEDQPTGITNEFSGLNELIIGHGYIPIVIDWSRSPNKAPQRKVQNVSNQMWLLIHYDGAIYSAYKNINSNEQLEQVLTSEKKTFTKVDEAFITQKESNNPADVLTYAQVISESYESFKANDIVDDYLKRVSPNQIDPQSLQKIVRISSSRPTTSRVYKLLKVKSDQASRVVGRDTVLNLQTSYIKRDLRNRGLLDPYNVWQRYENELGYEADSLYRLFALDFLRQPPIDQEMLYNEAFDYVNIYPDSPWRFLNNQYSLVVPNTTKKEDLEILLELISYQVSRDPSYRQMDMKAYLLYKLGFKERGLSLVQEVMRDAKSKGVAYDSLIKTLNK